MADELDRKIIQALNRNARKSYREIAKEVGSSVTSVIHRIKKFEEAGAIRGYIPVVDQEYFGLSMSAIIALRISRGKLLDIQQKIAQDPRIAAVYDVTGDWDSIIIGYFRDRLTIARDLPDAPIIACGGVSDARHVVEYMLAGADAVAIGTAHFAEPRVAGKITKNLRKYMARHSVAKLSDLKGAYEPW